MSSYYPAFGSGPVQPCQRCRQPLSPREVQCSNCGYYNSFAQTAFAPPQPAMGGLQPGDTNGYQPEAFAQPPQKKGGLKFGLIIAIVALLVVLIGGGLFAYISFKKAPGSTPQATSHVVTTSTPKGRPLFTDSFTNNKNG